MGLFADDGCVKMVELGSKGSGNQLVLAQDSFVQVNGYEVIECSKGGSGMRWGSAECLSFLLPPNSTISASLLM